MSTPPTPQTADPDELLGDSHATTEKGLRSNSVGLLGAVALGLSAVAPAYSFAITLGLVVMVVGQLAPAALLLGFVPILLTAFAFRELNKEMPDCGTTFVWTTRAFGPSMGWLSGGWVVQIATVIAMTALANVGATYLLTLLGLGEWADNTLAVTTVGVALLAAVTSVAYRGIELARTVQYALLGLQLVSLIGFGVVAFTRPGAEAPSLSWLNPLGFTGFGPFAEAVLLCLFIYWGWDALITVNEETRDKDRTPGQAAVISTLVLLATYLFTAFAAISFAGVGTDGLGLGNPENTTDILATLGSPVLGAVLAKVLQLAICVSAVAALLTCVIGSPRTTLSMASHGALPRAFARIHPRFQTPSFGTVFFGVAAGVLLTGLTVVSTEFLGDAILSIGLLIALYYGVTGLACVWYFRHHFARSARDAVVKGVLPLLGALMMLAAFARSALDMIEPDYGTTSFDGIGGVFLLGIGSVIVGAIVMLALRPRFKEFFATGRDSVASSTITSE